MRARSNACERRGNPRCHRGIGLVCVARLRRCVRAMVEPCSIGIALETMHGASISNLDRADLLDRNRKQQARIAHGVRCPADGDVCTIAQLYRNDCSDQQQQHAPYGEQPRTGAAFAQRCLHHTAMPTSAISAGISTIDRKNVPFICRLVRLTRGRS